MAFVAISAAMEDFVAGKVGLSWVLPNAVHQWRVQLLRGFIRASSTSYMEVECMVRWLRIVFTWEVILVNLIADIFSRKFLPFSVPLVTYNYFKKSQKNEENPKISRKSKKILEISKNPKKFQKYQKSEKIPNQN